MPRSPRRRRRQIPMLPIATAAGVVVLFLGLWIADTAARQGEVTRNVEVNGVDLGGLGDEDLRAALENQTSALAERSVDVTAGDTTLTFSLLDLGAEVDLEATAEAAMDANRGWVVRPLIWAGSVFSTTDVTPVYAVDETVATSALEAFDTTTDFVAPELTMQDGRLVSISGAPGQRASADGFADRLLAALEDGEDPIALELELIQQETSRLDLAVAEMAELMNALTNGGITVNVGDESTVLEPAALRPLLSADIVGEEARLAIDNDALGELLNSRFPGIVDEGTDASFAVAFGQVVIEGGDPALICCDDDAGVRLVEELAAGNDEIDLELQEVERDRGRAWAESLGVTELVGTFTTNYTPGQSRNQNIERISEITQGVLIESGETFSVNDFVGQRTIEKGFVAAGVINNGVFTEDVGGGISQYATTLFNAAFFAGLDFGQYQSHSVYIDRYPYGREATLWFPHVDLQIVNTTPYAVLLWPTTTDRSITVDLFSTQFAIGEQTGQVQEPRGAACTRVTTERTRSYVDGRDEKVDTVFAIYRPEGTLCSGASSVPTTVPPTTTTTIAPTATTTAAPGPTFPPGPITTTTVAAPASTTTTLAPLAATTTLGVAAIPSTTVAVSTTTLP